MSSNETIHIDGRLGEGGGQVLRSSLTLAAALGRPVTIENVRGGRRKPGLLRQHRTALHAVQRATSAFVEGDELGSTSVHFRPNAAPVAGVYDLSIGSAGSTMLVLQTLLPVLMLADAPSEIRLTGGTHAMAAPPFEAVAESFLPCLQAMGVDVSAELVRHGFFPVGGGEVRVRLTPVDQARPFHLLERGEAAGATCDILIQNLPDDIAEREWTAFQRKLHWKRNQVSIRRIQGQGPGNAILARLRFGERTTVLTGFGRRNARADRVAAELAGDIKQFIQSAAPVDEHLADQLMLPMALLAGGTYRCSKVSLHAETNAEVINRFFPGQVQIERSTSNHTVEVAGRAMSSF